MEICGVKFSDEKQYKAVLYAAKSLEIESMQPTRYKIEAIKALLDGTATPEQIKERFM